eukprot:TRINITY_DN58941_c0_g1_i1.p1 TRINITY_DN58941_c0_g1~~TRINITY_DN58941_c0_g1_i1.p1  ORF type:complete len:407 (+),score=59.70 TRINITY_DN58941_c0_g1_i1:18-1238(+)
MDSRMSDNVVESANAFSLALFTELYKKYNQRNMFVSPLNVAHALMMLIPGATGRTKEELRQRFGVSGDVSVLKKVFHVAASTDPKVKIMVGNSGWVKPGALISDEYKRVIQDNFEGEMFKLSSVDDVNEWISKKTNGLIPQMLDKLPPCVMLLISAIYFDAKWAKPFETSCTIPHPFTCLRGEVKQVPLMYRADKMEYKDTPTYQIASLDYGDKPQFAIAFVLPKLKGPDQPPPTSSSGLPPPPPPPQFPGGPPSAAPTPNYDPEALQASMTTLLTELGPNSFTQLVGGLNCTPGSLWIPKLDLEWGVEDLKDALVKLDLGSMFNGGLEGIGPELQVEAVLHKAVMKMDEEGTVAAAVTVVPMAPAGPPPVALVPWQMKVDRPFFFFIYNKLTKTPIFCGSVAELK